MLIFLYFLMIALKVEKIDKKFLNRRFGTSQKMLRIKYWKKSKCINVNQKDYILELLLKHVLNMFKIYILEASMDAFYIKVMRFDHNSQHYFILSKKL